jgi:hypothetical protein
MNDHRRGSEEAAARGAANKKTGIISIVNKELMW